MFSCVSIVDQCGSVWKPLALCLIRSLFTVLEKKGMKWNTVSCRYYHCSGKKNVVNWRYYRDPIIETPSIRHDQFFIQISRFKTVYKKKKLLRNLWNLIELRSDKEVSRVGSCSDCAVFSVFFMSPILLSSFRPTITHNVNTATYCGVKSSREMSQSSREYSTYRCAYIEKGRNSMFWFELKHGTNKSW